MPISSLLSKLPFDRYLLLLVATVGLASLFPAQGLGADILGNVTKVLIAVLFFLYGSRLSPQAALQGLAHWRLHLLVLAGTYLLFPALGLAFITLAPDVLSPPLKIGLIYLCALPSTVQSSIAFTSIARGNVAAALCSASASNLLGIVLTPLLVGLLLGAHAGISTDAIWKIMLQLLVPFMAGQLLRPWLGKWIASKKSVLGLVDRGSILLVVYAAFSEGMVAGIWSQLGFTDLGTLLAINAVLLAIVLGVMTFAARRSGFNVEDEIAVVFCGSKKSLVTGLPMASVLFAGPTLGLIVLPIMLFHQIQLMTCAALARRYAARDVVRTHAVAAE